MSYQVFVLLPAWDEWLTNHMRFKECDEASEYALGIRNKMDIKNIQVRVEESVDRATHKFENSRVYALWYKASEGEVTKWH